MSLAAPIPPSPRAACAGSRQALGQGQPRDGISDWAHAASARRLPQDELLPLLQGTRLCPPEVMEQVLLGWEKMVVLLAAHPRALGGAVGIDWGSTPQDPAGFSGGMSVSVLLGLSMEGG